MWDTCQFFGSLCSGLFIGSLWNISDFDFEEINAHITKVPSSMSSELDPSTETKTKVEPGTSSELKDQSAGSSKPVTKEVRFRPITEEEDGASETVAWQQSARPKSQSPTQRASPTLHFYSGNPGVEKVKGILHIYKDK